VLAWISTAESLEARDSRRVCSVVDDAILFCSVVDFDGGERGISLFSYSMRGAVGVVFCTIYRFSSSLFYFMSLKNTFSKKKYLYL
jgi:hypothetical protein